jgi:uridylate kinase
MKKTYIISVGGSLIVPNGGIDWKFLKNFRKLIIGEIRKGRKFFLVSGGGATARNYISAADKIVRISDEDRDWLGIHATRINAHLLRTVLFDHAHPEIIKNPTFRLAAKEKIIIAGGWKPGWSTDYVAAMIAQEYEIKTIINLSNVDYAYDRDPGKFKNAKAIKEIDWKNFRKIVGNAWKPGLNAPFDPVASRKAESLGLEVVVMNGKDFLNLKNFFSGRKFKGTVIK